MADVILLGAFGRTGSTAFRELIRQHPDVYAIPIVEFRFLTDPDGFLNLESALIENWTPWQADFAIDRFLKLADNLGKYLGRYVRSDYRKHFINYDHSVNTFIEKLLSYTYRGAWGARATLFNKVLLKLFKGKRNFLNSEKIYYTKILSSDTFYQYTQQFIQDLYVERLKIEKKTKILLHEPFVILNPVKTLKLSGSNKLLVFFRDPRDVFGSFQTRDWSPKIMEHAIEFQKRAIFKWIEQKKLVDKNLYLEIKFEDMIHNFEGTIQQIENFLELKISSELIEKSNFSPQKANVGRWKKQFSEEKQELLTTAFKEVLDIYHYHA